MAIYHFSVKTISRSAGRTATAAAAYRSATDITDERTGEIHTYRHKKGVVESAVILPPDAPKWAADRPALWNAAEAAEKRKNSTVAREIVVALPAEIDGQGRARIVREFAEKLAEKHRCAVDYAIHEPNAKGDDRNHHAHILMSTRRLSADGFTEKTREWDDRKSGTVQHWRAAWADHLNRHMEQSGLAERVSHLSLAEQGIDDREPTRHKGVAATAIERRNRAAIEADTTLRATAKSRAMRTRQPQKTALPEPADGHRFGQPAEQTPLQREAARLEAELDALKAEREQERQREAEEKARQEREAAERQQQKAEKEREAWKQYEQAQRSTYRAMPTAKLIEAYQQADHFRHHSQELRKVAEAGDWFRQEREALERLDSEIHQLRKEMNTTYTRYWDVQKQREERLFGLGAFVSKVQGDNELQQQLKQAYFQRKQAVSDKENEQEERRQAYSKRLDKETAILTGAAKLNAVYLADEINRRPEQEFTEQFRQAAAQSRTGAGRDAVKRIEEQAARHRSQGSKADERVSYYTGTATVQKAEQLAQRQQERRQQRERGRGDDFGYSR